MLCLYSEFIHLHLHTQYNLLTECLPSAGITKPGKEYKNGFILAITEPGNMFERLISIWRRKKQGLNLIIGARHMLLPAVALKRVRAGIEEASYHLILLH